MNLPLGPKNQRPLKWERSPVTPGQHRKATLLLLLLTALSGGLSGCGSGTQAVPIVGAASATLSATTLSFGQVSVGSSATQQVTLSSSGSADLMYLSFALSDSTNFGYFSTCGTSVAAGTSCTITVTFQPTSTGTFSGTLSLRNNAADSPQKIALSGSGTAVPLPQASLSAGSLTFSDLVGSSTDVKAVTLSNTGTAPLLLTGVTLSDPVDFSLASTCGASLQPAASCVLSITFQAQGRSAAAKLTLADNAGGVTGTTQVVALSGTGIPPVSSVMNFGDSITCGYYALPQDGAGYIYSTQGYAGLLDASLAKPAQNLCRPGDQAADMARLWVYPTAVPHLGSQQLYTVLIGTNDAAICGASAGCLANWSSELTASLTWLALPASDKVLGSAVSTRSGTWSTDFYGIGLLGYGPGATLTIPVTQAVAGRNLYLGYRVFDGTVGSATVALDGVQVAMLNGNPTTGHALLTQNGTNDTVFVATVPLGAAGKHTITLTTSPSATVLPFGFLWAGVASGSYGSALNAPRVLIGGVTSSTNASLQSYIDTYNGQLGSLVAGLTADGMDVEIVPTANALNPATDLVDIVHPNNSGHLKLKAAFLTVLP